MANFEKKNESPRVTFEGEDHMCKVSKKWLKNSTTFQLEFAETGVVYQ